MPNEYQTTVRFPAASLVTLVDAAFSRNLPACVTANRGNRLRNGRDPGRSFFKLLGFERPDHPVHQIARTERLGDIVDRAQFPSDTLRFRRSAAAHDDHRRNGKVTFRQQFKKAVTADIRQDEIEEDQIRPLTVNTIEGLTCGGCGRNVKPSKCQRRAYDVCDDRLVFQAKDEGLFQGVWGYAM
jgi:hypothetical protein